MYCIAIKNDGFSDMFKLYDRSILTVIGDTIDRVVLLAYKRATDMPPLPVPLVPYDHTVIARNSLNTV